MNSGYFNAVMPFAQQSGLKLDEQSGVIYGNYQGYDITILPTGSGKTFQLSFSVKRGEEAPNITEMQKLTRLYKSLFLGAITDRYSVSFNIKSAGFGASAAVNKKLIPALSAAVTFLRSENYTNCCAGCGKIGVNGSYYIYNSPSVLCDSCFEAFKDRHNEARRNEEQKSENLIGGIVGALLGSLIGALAIILISRLGYVAAISGVIMGVCTLKGYEMLGGKLTKRGVIASCIIMFIMVLLSYQIDTAIALYSLDDYKELGFFGCFRLLNYAMFNGGIDWGSYLPDLILLYAFTALGAVPTVSNTLKKHESLGKVYRMGSYAVQSEENINI